MFETNTQTNSSLISLAKAAEITGYHQDYLGQLCRLGRLPAKKVGRNWFTSKLALQALTSPAEERSQEPADELQQNTRPSDEAIIDALLEVREQATGQTAVPVPEVAQNVTISQVEGMPIMIRTMPVQVTNTNNVQSIVTALRIESLQREVLELRDLLSRLMAEVSRHGELLQSREFSDLWSKRDSIKHSYVSNFDFAQASNYPKLSYEQAVASKKAPKIWEEPQPRYSVLTWIVASATVAAIVYIGSTVALGTFLGGGQDVQTVYFHSEIDPTVAGATVELPPQNVDSEAPNMVQ